MIMFFKKVNETQIYKNNILLFVVICVFFKTLTKKKLSFCKKLSFLKNLFKLY